MGGGRRLIPVGSIGRRVYGTTFLYVLPCANEDHAKLGIAGDPLVRMQTFSSRYYEFFDLDAGWLLEAATVAEARAWETTLKRQLRAHAAPAPLLVPARAGGRTEWVRGALSALAGWRDAQVEQGFVAHAPLRGWVRQRLLQAGADLQHHVQAMVERFGAVAYWPPAVPGTPLGVLRDVLDACVLLETMPDDLGQADLDAWHRRNSGVSLPAVSPTPGLERR